MTEQLPAGSYVRLLFQCSPYHKDNALHPFIDQLQREADFAPGDSIEQRLEKMRTLVAHTVPDSKMAVSLLAVLLSLDRRAADPAST